MSFLASKRLLAKVLFIQRHISLAPLRSMTTGYGIHIEQIKYDRSKRNTHSSVVRHTFLFPLPSDPVRSDDPGTMKMSASVTATQLLKHGSPLFTNVRISVALTLPSTTRCTCRAGSWCYRPGSDIRAQNPPSSRASRSPGTGPGCGRPSSACCASLPAASRRTRSGQS